jgi:hypothetical protein
VNGSRLPRTIRLDPSDAVVFAEAAAPGEWAVTGTFLFAGCDTEALGRKARIAFRTGFLGIASFGFSTLVVVTEARDDERAAAIETLTGQLVDRLGAPDAQTARAAAAEEIAFAADLCAGHAVGTLVALHRGQDADGAIRERFRTLRPRGETTLGGAGLRGHDKAFFAVESDEAEPEAPVDLVALLKARRS